MNWQDIAKLAATILLEILPIFNSKPSTNPQLDEDPVKIATRLDEVLKIVRAHKKARGIGV